MSSEIDFDILLISTTNMNILYMMAPEDLVKELSDKYQITSSMEMLQHSVTNHVSEAYNIAIIYDGQMTQTSIFLRNTE